MLKTSKKERILTALLDAGMKGLMKLEVATPFHGYQMQHFSGQFWSSSLNSDVSALGKMGVAIDRRNEPYTSQDGTRSLFKRYWLQDHTEAWRAVDLINQYRLRRKGSPLPMELATLLVNQFPPEMNLINRA